MSEMKPSKLEPMPTWQLMLGFISRVGTLVIIAVGIWLFFKYFRFTKPLVQTSAQGTYRTCTAIMFNADHVPAHVPTELTMTRLDLTLALYADMPESCDDKALLRVQREGEDILIIREPKR